MDYQPMLDQLYQDFNDRRIDAILTHLHPAVAWPNGWEGGYVTGHDDVRAYWVRQWQQINPKVEPISFDTRPDGQIAIRVHQVIHDVAGQLLSDDILTHVYSVADEKVRTMTIER